jgi:GTP-binding protein HflX
MNRDRHGRTGPSRHTAPGDAPPRARQRAVAVGVMPDGEDLGELTELLRTAGVAVTAELVQHREQPHPNLYLGPGKVTELKALVESSGANLVACDDELTPRQERNLEAELGVPVVDRTAVILDIFAGHAHTAEGKLQVELAQLEYNLARMRGLWTHLERLGGGIGTRGPGESQIETDRRLARNRIASLRRRLEQVRATRSVMRAERERAQLPTVALAGYTNAGKSTLLNALTGASVGVRDRLFHTLDPTTRTMRLDGRTYLATDTVGFIRKLPHQLVDAFAATLEETRLADLILHVVDASATEEELVEMVRAVEDVLAEIGVAETPTLLVLNKADLLDADRRREIAFRHPDGILVSAVTGEGLETVGLRVSAEFERRLQDVDLLVPFAEGTVLSELHELAGDLTREETPAGVRVHARLPALVAERFGRYRIDDDPVSDGGLPDGDGGAPETLLDTVVADGAEGAFADGNGGGPRHPAADAERAGSRRE